MAEINLKVPYKSQHGEDSKQSRSDCGASSLAMVLEFFGRPTTTGQVLQKLKNPTGFLNWDQLKWVAEEWGFNAKLKSIARWEDIKNCLDNGIPVIVVGGYGYLKSVQDKNFKASHIMVIVGYRDDGSVYANDPNFFGDLINHGDHHVYTKEEFENFWNNANNLEQNRPHTMFIVTPKNNPSGKPRIVVTSLDGVRVRREATTLNKTAKNIIRVVKQGVEMDIFDKVVGENVDGYNIWFKVVDGYCWGGAVQEVLPLPDGTPPTVSAHSPVVIQPKPVPIQPTINEDLYTRLVKDNEELKKENESLKQLLKRLQGISMEVDSLIVQPKTEITEKEAVIETKNKLTGYWDSVKKLFNL